MAEILIKAIDAPSFFPLSLSNPAKAMAGCYRRGDPVVVMPDGHEWGKEERLPKFYVLQIPNLPVKDAKKYIESEVDNIDPEKPAVLTRRLFTIKVDDMPEPFKSGLLAGKTSASWNAMRGFFQNKVTLETE